MKKQIAVIALFASTALAQHDATHSHHPGVDTRGDQAMGFSHEKTTHHFIRTRSGGIIDVIANESSDAESVASIRRHLKHIASEFSKGNYELPMFIHDRVPPGVEVMRERKDVIRFRYEERKNGARVVITSRDAAARAAIHDFLRFQISDHRTGDP